MTAPSTTLPAPDTADDDVILLQPEAAKLVRLSTRSVQRLDETGDFVPRVQLTGRRIGYWRRDVLHWLHKRTTPAKQAA